MKVSDRDSLLDDTRVDEVARRKFKAVLRDVRGYGLPLVVWEVYRSKEKQRALYAQGRDDSFLIKIGYTIEEIKRYRSKGYTKEKPIVTKIINPKYHATGKAMDCCWLVNGRLTWDVSLEWWEIYGKSAKSHDLTWGGDWRMRDYAHVQYDKKE